LRRHISWVHAQRDRLNRRVSAVSRPLADGDTVMLWGDALTLRIIRGRAGARCIAYQMIVSVADPSDAGAVAFAIDALYRREVREVLPDVLAKWGAELGRMPSKVTIRTMKTRWGSCTVTSRAIRINPTLAAHHPRCLSYVVLHEMVHMFESSHGPGFQSMMDAHLPNWRAIRAELNSRK